MRELFGVAAPVFIAVCLVKSDFLDWSTRKVSTYLPSVCTNCQDLRGEKSALTVPLSKTAVFVSFPTRMHCELVPFHNKEFPHRFLLFHSIGALKPS
jgi:hypothetical protein